MSSDRKKKSTISVYRTIRCHLDASENILRQVWEEMTQKNTPLIVQLLKSVNEQPEFEANKEKGEITKKEIVELRKIVTKNPEIEEQSGRLRSSAESFVKEVYSSWLTLYQIWTADGTEEVRKEKTDKAQKGVSKAEENKKTDKAQKRLSKAEENKKLENNQQIQLNKDKSSLSRLKNSFARPSKLVYRGQSNIIVGK